ncbi:MAG: hypothetical protein RR945_02620 [Erysipelotrichaceae bacterium]
MKLYYSTNRLEKTLSDNRQIKKNYPREYNKIINRLSELIVANSLSEISHVPPPRRHKLSGNKDGCWGIDYSPSFRIIIKPVNEFDVDDLTTVTEIMIMSLENYH